MPGSRLLGGWYRCSVTAGCESASSGGGSQWPPQNYAAEIAAGLLWKERADNKTVSEEIRW